MLMSRLLYVQWWNKISWEENNNDNKKEEKKKIKKKEKEKPQTETSKLDLR